MEAGISQEESEKLRGIFSGLTENNEGLITEASLAHMLVDLGVDQVFASPLLRMLSGSDRDRSPDFESFTQFFDVLRRQDFKGFFRLLFKAIDTNGDGKIAASDLVELSSLIGEQMSIEAAQQTIDDCELEGGSFDEFWAWFCREHGLNYE